MNQSSQKIAIHGSFNRDSHSRNRFRPIPFLSIWESEMQFMGNAALAYGNIETGGDCFGLFSHAGRPVIALATPPGPEAVHQNAHFRQDVEFTKRISGFLSDNFGLNYIGNFHSHHSLSIKSLSSRDITSTHSIASKNSYDKMCQILLTFENNAAVKNQINWDRFKLSKRVNELSDKAAIFRYFRQNYSVKVHTFFYSDAKDEQPIRCPVKILPGKSPFRTCLEQNQIMDIGMEYLQFAETDIQFDIYKPEIEPDIELPKKIHNQLTKLLENVPAEFKIKSDDEFLFISMPLKPGENVLTVAYKNIIPHPITGVFISDENDNSDPVDLTSELLSRDYNCDFWDIFQGIQKILENRLDDHGDCAEKQTSVYSQNLSNQISERICEDDDHAFDETEDSITTKEEIDGET